MRRCGDAIGTDLLGDERPSRREGRFEVIAGRSVPLTGKGKGKGKGKVLGFVHKLEHSASSRLQHLVASHGGTTVASTTFITDGGETVRQAQGQFRGHAETVLDWFHVAMRFTHMLNSVDGLNDIETEERAAVRSELKRAKAHLWHGCPERCYAALEEARCLIYWSNGEHEQSLNRKIDEFYEYIRKNEFAVVNYADRQRNGEPFSTSIAESAVNQVVSKRMVKKQQMRWSMAGAHRLIQVRTRVLNEQLRDGFCRWNPRMTAPAEAA